VPPVRRGPQGPEATPGEAVRSFTLDPVSLFLFSAACGLTHRIHYDEEYARREGFDGLPVQGPLQGALISQAFDEIARRSGRRLAALEIRHVAPAYADRELLLRASTARAGPGAPDSDTAQNDTGQPVELIDFRLETSLGVAVTVGTASLAPGSPPLMRSHE
jgi:hydroxyacyl-ACP dehydratase HTD2-like protein with hotdog domain